MTDAATQAASTTIRWYSRVRMAAKSAAAWVVLDAAPAVFGWVRKVATFAGRAWSRAKEGPIVPAFTVFLIVAWVAVAWVVLGDRRSAPAQPVTAPAADQLQSLESRVSALESTMAGLMAVTAAPASPSARRPATAAPAAATHAPPTGQTDLDRRLAEFQRRIDATPSSTTTLKESAK